MARDQAQWIAQVETVVDQAQTILVLKVEQGTVDCKATRITNSDAARFERFAHQLQLEANNPAVMAS
ncbi:hypothetical protein NDA01_30205 [Trichocoleus desertorum AS-A10]|uniref:hypothetical protein n=1 Tax=Trichocoleus desertorum TaxID=1481672 RepID=UPI003296E02E